MGFHRFSWVFMGFQWLFMGFQWVPPELSCASLCSTRCYWVFTWFNRISIGFTGFLSFWMGCYRLSGSPDRCFGARNWIGGGSGRISSASNRNFSSVSFLRTGLGRRLPLTGFSFYRVFFSFPLPFERVFRSNSTESVGLFDWVFTEFLPSFYLVLPSFAGLKTRMVYFKSRCARLEDVVNGLHLVVPSFT